MTTNVLPAAFVILATYALIAFGKSVIPGFGTLPNNAIRGIGYVICYALSAVNLMVQQQVHWQDLWGLLPVAGALFSTAALLYHIGSDNPSAQPAPDAPAHIDLSLPLTDPRQPAWAAVLAQQAPPASAAGVARVPGITFPRANASPPSSAPVSESPDQAPVGPSVSVPDEPPAP